MAQVLEQLVDGRPQHARDPYGQWDEFVILAEGGVTVTLPFLGGPDCRSGVDGALRQVSAAECVGAGRVPEQHPVTSKWVQRFTIRPPSVAAFQDTGL